MKKIFKVIGIIVGVIVIALLGFAAYLKMTGLPHFSDVQRPTINVELTPARIERGKRIVSMMCYDCHFNPTTNRLTGHYLPEVPPLFGRIYSHNITADKTHGIGSWTDGELVYFLRTGIRKDGLYIPPFMPKFPHVADEDMSSIIAFLRSNDTLVAPTAIADTAGEFSMMTLFLSRVAFGPLEYPKQPISVPSASNQVAIGKYWADGVLGCYQCHSADFKTNDAIFPEKSPGFYGGGNEMKDFNDKVIYTANITPDMNHGIGKWDANQFLHALRDGLRPDNTALRYPMARVPDLSDSEIVAIYAYLKTIPAIATANKVSEGYTLTNANPTIGEKAYYKYACYTCHGTNGVGVCDLTHACTKYRTDEQLIAWIKNPSKILPGSKMPNWEGTIKEEEFVPLAAYVRLLGTKTAH